MRSRRTSFSLIRDTRYRNGPHPKIDATRLTPKSEVKYLGTVLNCKLACSGKGEKATVAYASKKMLSSTWGLSPSLMRWCVGGASDSAVWSSSVVASQLKDDLDRAYGAEVNPNLSSRNDPRNRPLYISTIN